MIIKIIMMIKKAKYILIFFFIFCYAKNNALNSIDSQIAKIVKAIHTRDTAYIYQHVFEDVQTGFDADGMGIASFKERWNLSTTSEDDWNMLSKIVNSGWRLVIDDGDSLLEFPSINILCDDSATNINKDFILFDKTPILDNPNGDTLVVSIPTVCNILKSVDQWNYIEFGNKKKGYVHDNHMYHCYDFRMYLEKDQNDWKIKMIVAGD